MTRFLATKNGVEIASWSDVPRSDGSVWDINHWENSWGDKTGVTIQSFDMSLEMAATLNAISQKQTRISQLQNAIANWSALTATQKDTILKTVLAHLIS